MTEEEGLAILDNIYIYIYIYITTKRRIKATYKMLLFREKC